jgi:hypothetical protein
LLTRGLGTGRGILLVGGSNGPVVGGAKRGQIGSQNAGAAKVGQIEEFGQVVLDWRCGNAQPGVGMETFQGRKRLRPSTALEAVTFVADQQSDGRVVWEDELFDVATKQVIRNNQNLANVMLQVHFHAARVGSDLLEALLSASSKYDALWLTGLAEPLVEFIGPVHDER